MDEALRTAENLRERIGDFRFVWDERTFRLGVSVGVVPITPATDDVASLLFVAWAGITLAISATRREAGPAIGWASGLIATSFVIEFLTRVWKPIAWMRPLSLFTYYRPQDIVRTGLGWIDPLVLGVVAAAGLVTAIVAFERRDL
jgi:hypothetical protein